MTEVLSTRATIRQVVLDAMEVEEVRTLVRKVQEGIDSGYVINEELLEEYIAEIVGGRYAEEEEDD